jgi:hypothetical protein
MSRPKWLDILEQVGPMVLLFTPLAPIAPIVIAGIMTAESIKGATGPQKKELVMQLVAQGAAGTNLAANKTVIDPTLAVVVTTHHLEELPGSTTHAAPLHE